jgi:16S rRNA G966 N2-methylase RsmD
MHAPAHFSRKSIPARVKSSQTRTDTPSVLGPGNHLLYGDNATVMRTMMGSQSVDLIYLDPPFKSDKNYNLI